VEPTMTALVDGILPVLATLVRFLVVIGVLIFVHELGHFLFAKRAKVRVERFSLGFGPPLWRRQRGETEYRLSAIPLGGYVKMYGENPEEEVREPTRSFLHQSVWTRIPIVAAGPLFNFFFAIVLIAVVYVVGIPIPTAVQVGQIMDGSPAAQANLRPNDLVLAFEEQAVTSIDALKAHIMASEGRTVRLRVKRDEQELVVSVTPTQDTASQEWRIGVELRPAAFVVQRTNPLFALGQGVAWTWRITRLSFVGLGKLITGNLPASEGLAGPIGIAVEMGRQADYGWRSVVFFTAAISVSLAILNLLPIPVLDGGHLLFFAIEIINGAPLSLRKREIAQQVGLLILASLMIFAFYNDVMRLFFPS
jgi:regulator of sigma E protease